MPRKATPAVDARDREPARPLKSLVTSAADRSAQRLASQGWTVWPLRGAAADLLVVRDGAAPTLVRCVLAREALSAWQTLRACRVLRSWCADGGNLVRFHVWTETSVGVWKLDERNLGLGDLLSAGP